MKPEATMQFGPATQQEIGGVIDLMNMRPPAYWMRSHSAADLRVFLGYALESPRSVVLVARQPGEDAPAGYVFATIDSTRFWSGFALRNPGLASSIVFHRVKRIMELRRKTKPRASADAAAAGLPAFSWSPSRPDRARIIGLYVRNEHRARGVAMDLYFNLFDALKDKGCSDVEEYAAPDYAQFAGKFPELCGWKLRQCACGGFKINRAL